MYIVQFEKIPDKGLLMYNIANPNDWIDMNYFVYFFLFTRKISMACDMANKIIFRF